MLRGFHNWLYPELALFPSEGARKDAERRVRTFLVRSPRMWLTLAPAVAGVALVEGFDSFFRRSPIMFGTVALAMVMIVGIGGGILLIPRDQIRLVLRACLRMQSIPLCLQCGYDLQGRAGDNCPECGHPHELGRAAQE